MKLKHLFLTFSFVVGIFSVAFAQQQTALNVATTNPSESMNFAGNEQACFVSNITNSATDGSDLPIEGLDLIRMVGVTASSTQFVALQSGGIAEGQLMITVTNSSLEPLNDYSVNINLPDGLIVTTQSGTPQINGFTIETSQNSYGATNATLNAPSGYSLQPNSSCTFTLTLQENKYVQDLHQKRL